MFYSRLARLAPQEEALIEPPFLWILSKGLAKESILTSGAIIRLNNCRESDHNIFKPLNNRLTSALKTKNTVVQKERPPQAHKSATDHQHVPHKFEDQLQC